MNVILCTTTALENWQHSGKFGIETALVISGILWVDEEKDKSSGG